MGIVMVAMLAFGGTFAYFTANANNITAQTTTGIITISTDVASTIQLSRQNVLPKETLLTSADTSQIAYDTTKASRNQIVFLTFTVTVEGSGSGSVEENEDLSLTIDPPDTIHVTDGSGTISTPVPFGASGNSNRVQKIAFVVPSTVNGFDMTGLQITFEGNAHSVNGAIPEEMGATITITIEACSIQALETDGTELDTIDTEAADRFYALYEGNDKS